MNKLLALNEMRDRSELGSFLSKTKLLGLGVEIGIAFGGFSRQILSQWNGIRLYLVDPLTSQDPTVYKENQKALNFDHYAEKDIPNLIREMKGRAEWVREFSVDAARKFPDEMFDFVYIDGNHSFEAVSADLEAWWPKLVPGGLFGGHDYCNITDWPKWSEAKRAVDVWATKKHLNPIEKPCSSWFLIKPEDDSY